MKKINSIPERILPDDFLQRKKAVYRVRSGGRHSGVRRDVVRQDDPRPDAEHGLPLRRRGDDVSGRRAGGGRGRRHQADGAEPGDAQ